MLIGSKYNCKLQQQQQKAVNYSKMEKKIKTSQFEGCYFVVLYLLLGSIKRMRKKKEENNEEEIYYIFRSAHAKLKKND